MKLALKTKTWGIVGIICLAVFGCQNRCGGHQSLSPEEVVQAYLDVAFNMNSLEQRNDLLQYTTGPLREAIAAASDETIKEAYLDKRYELQRYTVLERRDRTPRETEIMFQIVFRNLAKESANDKLKEEEIPIVTVENTVSVVKEKKVWLLKDVLNKKSSFVFPVAPEETQIKAKSP